MPSIVDLASGLILAITVAFIGWAVVRIASCIGK